MNVTIPEKPKKNPRRLATYIVIIIICIIAIGIAVYQFFADEKLGLILGITNGNSASEEQYESLKAEFDNIFINSFDQNDEININKIEQDKEIIYTDYEKTENSLNNYDINVHIPYININNDTIKQYNNEIVNTFEAKAESVVSSENKNIIYTVEYEAQISDNILSLIIRSNLKEGNSAQRVIVKTYNYDLQNNKELNLIDIMRLKEINRQEAQTKINSEITKAQNQAEELNKLGYNVFTRDSTSDIYKVENTTEFIIYNNYLYVIYPYGNQENTSEIDLVIF